MNKEQAKVMQYIKEASEIVAELSDQMGRDFWGPKLMDIARMLQVEHQKGEK